MNRLEINLLKKQISSNSFVYIVEARNNILFTSSEFFLPEQDFDKTNAWHQFFEYFNPFLVSIKKEKVMRINI
jgi:hypothetical protein